MYTDLPILGTTLTDVTVDDKDNVITFTVSDGRVYRMRHEQDCCESVTITDINGDVQDLIDSEILVAEERSVPADDDDDDVYDGGISEATFYTFRTNKGSVDIRWDGYSNGYYGVSVYFELVR